MRVISIILLFCIYFLLNPSSSRAESCWLFFSGGHSPGDTVSASDIASVTAVPGAEIRTVSRYFNAVSVDYDGDPATFEALENVAGVSPVRAMRVPETISGGDGLSAAKPASDPAAHTLSYGKSWPHLDALNIPAVHDMGLSGGGVVIGVLDSGFEEPESGCLEGVDILDRFNFITGTTDLSGDSHGSYVLSLLAAREEGVFYGAAFGASYLLAVTDDAATETRADEDRWVAAIEWCDSLGADIIASSLVYDIFDTEEDSYAKEDMEGKTSLVAKAAEIAWSRGMIVVNSVGNEGANGWGIVTTPADAEHVIAVGSVQQDWRGDYVLSAFSSYGPTADGRIKPDFVAPGVLKVPEPGSITDFPQISGTSLAAPLVSGILALVMEAHPGRSNEVNAEILRLSAVDMGDPGPDNYYGWGMIDSEIAVTLQEVSIAAGDTKSGPPQAFSMLEPCPNPFNASLAITLDLSAGAPVRLEALSLNGQRAALIHDSFLSPGIHTLTWQAGNAATGIYIIRASGGGTAIAKKALLIK